MVKSLASGSTFSPRGPCFFSRLPKRLALLAKTLHASFANKNRVSLNRIVLIMLKRGITVAYLVAYFAATEAPRCSSAFRIAW